MRTAVVAEALSWVGTPYHHAADIKGVGVDCAMILVRIFEPLLPAGFDPRPYPKDWMLHRSEERYLGWVERFADELDAEHDRMLAGDLRLWRFGRTFSHAAVAIDDVGNFVHAYFPAGAVIRGNVRETVLADRNQQLWRPRGLDG